MLVASADFRINQEGNMHRLKAHRDGLTGYLFANPRQKMFWNRRITSIRFRTLRLLKWRAYKCTAGLGEPPIG